ncbi:MAG: ABC transporter permease subunit [Firmicutes bacterium]|nr:ABC transporter permease subunit [Bacillota bacterium]
MRQRIGAAGRIITPRDRPWYYNHKKHKNLLLMMLPGLLSLFVFSYLPMYGMQIAFRDFIFKLGIWQSPWVGLKHFRDLFESAHFLNAFKNTLVISGLQLVFGFPAPIIFAVLLNEIRVLKFKKLVQTISYLPHFISWAVLGGMFIQLLSPSVGPVNLLLKTMGMQPIYFLAEPSWFRTVIVSTHIWQTIGWNSIVYIAAITNIDAELYEAGKIDGATRFQQIFYITLGALMPVITIMLIFAVGKIINDNFDQIFNLMTSPVESVGEVLSTYSYKIGLVKMQYSFSTAMGLFKNVISLLLILFANRVAKKINDYGLW